ncbi:hypothetical protein CDG76_34115 [Nostoc sp. 'Peltigera membranacea cyanobiont' 210A]|nr:hypothetical protein CDG76_34115 [Nostoc sp. 'Peltigera membranacea cyanobiont' 210A]
MLTFTVRLLPSIFFTVTQQKITYLLADAKIYENPVIIQLLILRLSPITDIVLILSLHYALIVNMR